MTAPTREKTFSFQSSNKVNNSKTKMICKFVFGFALATIAQAAVLPVATVRTAAPAPVAVAPAAIELEEVNGHPQYEYSYNVEDTVSGDSKGHVETRDGDVVRGEYSLIDADGFRRTVTYTADAINGFNAVVRREPLVVAAPASIVKTVVPAPLVKTVVSAPIVKTVAAPIVAPSPIVKTVIPQPTPILARTAIAAPLTYTATPTFTYRRL